MSAFSNEAAKSAVQSGGVRLAGQKFFTLSVNDRSIYGKKQVPDRSITLWLFRVLTSFFLSSQADGCVIVKTTQAVLVAEYAAPIQAPEATPIVESLADYLIGVGY